MWRTFGELQKKALETHPEKLSEEDEEEQEEEGEGNEKRRNETSITAQKIRHRIKRSIVGFCVSAASTMRRLPHYSTRI